MPLGRRIRPDRGCIRMERRRIPDRDTAQKNGHHRQMKKKPLGRTGLTVSSYCLGSMTWGNQTATAAAHRQIDMALDHGIDFIDTAEMYPVNPVRAETIGRTERVIGLWLEKNSRRADMFLATKHTGEGNRMVRDGAPISPATIREAVEGSLRRLQTDYIDLYQFHWPNRGSYHFRQNWSYAPWTATQDRAAVEADMRACLEALQAEVARGTIRHFGLSNETAWGMARWLDLAEAGAGPRAVTIQNEYSLLSRQFDTDLAELCHYEDTGLMAYSPLAAGLLTGKYQGRAVPPGSRMTLVPELGGRKSDRAFAAVDDYLDIAFKHDLDPVGMALAWVAQRPFVTTVIFGATDASQLERILAQSDLVLSPEVLDEIDAVNKAHPLPY